MRAFTLPALLLTVVSGCAHHGNRVVADYMFAIAGFVRDSDGQPIEGAQVTMEAATTLYEALTPVRRQELTTNEHGGFLVPFQYYGEVFDTTRVPPEEPTVGDLADDLLDIYTDVKAGLLYFERGHAQQAVFQWKFTWGVHWGRHATSALRAMHCWSTRLDKGDA
jgi:hypothetical protein